MADTKISWVRNSDGELGKTWNPIIGCSRVSEGCRNCYAERVAARFSGEGQPYEGVAKMVKRQVRQFKVVNDEPTGDFRTVTRSEPHWTGTVKLVHKRLSEPLKWKRPRMIFVNSMSDMFHESLENEQIAAIFGIMAACPQHTFQILTKRPKRMREWFKWMRQEAIDAGEDRPDYGLAMAGYSGVELGDGSSGDESDQQCKIEEMINDAWARDGADGGTVWDCPWPLPNVWLGTSVENQAVADTRIPELLKTPAAVRFLSCEPLLGAIDLHAIQIPNERDGLRFSSLKRQHDDRFGSSDVTINWVISGAESGPGARPCDVAWLRSLRDQCSTADVPFFLKQAAADELGHGCEIVDGRMVPLPITAGDSSKRKAGGVIELPYLDGVQHKEMPRG